MTNQNQTSPAKPPETAPPSSAGRPACAACKHQRRRCSTFCPLAPYFPSNKKAEFHNVHRLFGVNNVVSLLKRVPQNKRDNAVKSIVYEANIRAMNPVGGCYAVINDLQREIDLCSAELQIVAKNLAFHRGRWMRSFNGYDDVDWKPCLNNQESCGDQEMEKMAMLLNDKPCLTDE